MVLKMREMMKRRDNQKGFTLVELIIVMAILAVLAGIAVPKYTGILSKAKEDANKSNVLMIERAAELYCDATRGNLDAIGTLVTDGYLKANPDSPWGTATAYGVSATYNNGAVDVDVTEPTDKPKP